MIKDFTGVFGDMTESIFFDLTKDPYSSQSQPYTGSVSVNITIDKRLKVKHSDELCLMLTTKPFFEGIKYKKENLDYLSKCVYLPATIRSYTIKNVHPGQYYLYAFVDRNNDKKHLAGEYMGSNINNTFKLTGDGSTQASAHIDFVIP